jgi:large subunit ribosomal protein L9
MAHSLKVVFRSDVRGIAQAGDVKMVSPGYARNYLFPRELAFPATDAALKQWETERQATVSKAERKRAEAQNLAQKIESTPCVITAKAGDEGKLFGSVGRQEIAEALAKQGVTLDKHDIVLHSPIKQLGTTTVAVRLGGALQAQLKVEIVAEAPTAA